MSDPTTETRRRGAHPTRPHKGGQGPSGSLRSKNFRIINCSNGFRAATLPYDDDFRSRKPSPPPRRPHIVATGHNWCQVKSSVGADAALSLIDAIPFWAAAFEVYP